MKNTFFLFLLILLSSIANGQKITISDLTKVQKSNSDSFEKLAQQKGFEYTSTDIGSDYTIISYSHYNLKGKRSATFLHFYTWKINLYSVLYMTSDRSEYISLKTEASKLGYKLYKTEKKDSELITYYKKGELLVCFSTSTNIDKEKSEEQLFSIDIRPLALGDN